MIEIPRFELSEYIAIKRLLQEAGVPFEDKAINMSAWSWGGTHEYFFYVSPENLSEAISVIKSYYGIGHQKKETFTGHCPACDFEVTNSSECPDCGLFLSPDPSMGQQDHPFYIFLQQNMLL